MDAIQLEAKGGLAIFVNNHHTPAVPKDCLLVRTLAVRLNPHELLAIYPPWSFSEPGNLLGYDYAGVVEEVRPEVKSNFKKGDGVCGCTRPILCSPTRGTFATYVVVVVNVQLHIPDELSFEDAASLSVSMLTTGAVLCDTLGLPILPVYDELRRQILIYGGSTSMGRMILQFAKLSNFEIITTCSPNNINLVKSLGVDHVFDYGDPATPSTIRALTKDSLSLCIDCFSEQTSYEFCSQALSEGTTYVCIGPVQPDRIDIQFKSCIGVLYFNKPFELQGQVMESPVEKFDSTVRFAEVAERLLAEGKIKPHPKDVREGGLKGVLDGIQDLREKKARGRSLYTC